MNAYSNQKFGFVMQAKEPDIGSDSYAVQWFKEHIKDLCY